MKLKMSDVIHLAKVGTPKGHALLLKFIRAVECGDIPETSETRELAKAFAAIVFDSIDAEKALNLKRKRKRPRNSGEQQEKTDGPIAAFISHQLRKDKSRGSTGRAIEAASNKFHKTTRYIEKIWKRRRPFFLASQKVEKMATLWDKHLSPKERKQFASVDAVEIDKLVLERERMANNK